MTNSRDRLSRRHFLQTLAAVATIPLITRSGFAEDKDSLMETVPTKADDIHRILSCNILLASPANDGTPFAWSARKELCEKIIRNQNADIICMQEVLLPQDEDFKKDFPTYQSFGFAGPYMDQHSEGYQFVTKNVILFSKERYELVSAGGFWLSETPLIAGSKSWDSARGRHENWVRLKDRKTGRQFRVIDTHLDHKGQTARENQAKMIVEEAAQYQKDFPQLLAGDFNQTAKNKVHTIIKDAGWKDTFLEVNGPNDPGRTYHKMEGPKYKPGTSGKIDFIYARGNVKPIASRIIKDHENGLYPSDHYFLSADVKLTDAAPK